MEQSTFASNAEAASEAPRVWAGAVLVAILGGATLYERLPGLNWPLFVLAATLAFAWMRHHAAGRTPVAAWRSIVLANLLAASPAITGAESFHVLVLLGAGILAAHVVLVCAGVEREPADPARLALAPLRAAPRLFGELHARLEQAFASAGAAGSLPALRGLALAVPVALAFFLLLAGADATFGGWRDAAWASLADLSMLPRLAFTGVLLAAMLGALGLAARPTVAPADPDVDRPPVPRFADVERATVLLPVAAIFAAFLLLRLPELFADRGARAGSGVTYAQSVHEGFVQMTLAAALCATLLLVLERGARRGRHAGRIRLLGYVLVAESLLLLASAWQRVALYEAAYGYTAFRLYVHVAVVLVATGLALLAWELARGIDLARLTQRCSTVAALAVVVLCCWNHAGWIATRNLERFHATGRIDGRYLVHGLGIDAVPEVVDALPQLPESLAAELRGALAARYGIPGRAATDLASDGVEWNLRRAAAGAALARAGIVTGWSVAGRPDDASRRLAAAAAGTAAE